MAAMLGHHRNERMSAFGSANRLPGRLIMGALAPSGFLGKDRISKMLSGSYEGKQRMRWIATFCFIAFASLTGCYRSSPDANVTQKECEEGIVWPDNATGPVTGELLNEMGHPCGLPDADPSFKAYLKDGNLQGQYQRQWGGI